MNINSFTRRARAASDPTRVRMLKLLESGELCVCEIMEVLGLGQSTASKHLGVLRDAGLVESRKEGTWSYYRLADGKGSEGLDFLRLVASRVEDQTARNDRKVLSKKRKACSRKT